MEKIDSIQNKIMPCVIIFKNSVIEKNILCNNAEHARKTFLEQCEIHLPDWNNYHNDYQTTCLKNGFAEFEHGSIYLSWAISEF